MSQFDLKVQNQSGKTASYIVTSEPPPVQGPADKTWPSVIAKARVPQEATARFSIDLPNPCYAYAIYTEGKPGQGSGVEVSTKLPVTLGKKDSSGNLEGGTTLTYELVDGAPTMRQSTESGGLEGAFSVKSGSFSVQDAKAKHYLLGFGSKSTPWSVFAVQPQTTYQIQPVKVLYLTAADHREGTLVDVDSFSDSLKLDLEQLDGGVSVTQTPDGKFVIDN